MKLREIRLLGSYFKCEHLGCDAPALYSLIFIRHGVDGTSSPHYDRCTYHAKQMAARHGAKLPEVTI